MLHSHLSEDQIIEVCLQGAPAAAEQRHLDGCPDCAERRASLARLLADVSVVAAAEADAVFTSERLSSQQARILQRIARDSRPGRVITFPAGNDRGSTLLRARPEMRWVASAAAAGLVIGLLVGRFAHEGPGGVAAQPSLSGGRPVTESFQSVSAALSEEEFLGRLEMAIESTSGSALRPLDDLTPLIWEIAAQ